MPLIAFYCDIVKVCLAIIFQFIQIIHHFSFQIIFVFSSLSLNRIEYGARSWQLATITMVVKIAFEFHLALIFLYLFSAALQTHKTKTRRKKIIIVGIQ